MIIYHCQTYNKRTIHQNIIHPSSCSATTHAVQRLPHRPNPLPSTYYSQHKLLRGKSTNHRIAFSSHASWTRRRRPTERQSKPV
ncbi:hypothetical protein EVA_02294 [gut metagenome]|uniref:Uncharacterized protein n=1 Tax=gut metagenome TaxID=749906 RepID=J9GPF9_9ZZZZ